jgi:hypothetical protein
MRKLTIETFYGIKGHQYLTCPYDNIGPISLLQMMHHMAIKKDVFHSGWRQKHQIPEYIDNIYYAKHKNNVMGAIIKDIEKFH